MTHCYHQAVNGVCKAYVIKMCQRQSGFINRTSVRYLSDNKIKESLEVIAEYMFCCILLGDVFRTQSNN